MVLIFVNLFWLRIFIINIFDIFTMESSCSRPLLLVTLVWLITGIRSISLVVATLVTLLVAIWGLRLTITRILIAKALSWRSPCLKI